MEEDTSGLLLLLLFRKWTISDTSIKTSFVTNFEKGGMERSKTKKNILYKKSNGINCIVCKINFIIKLIKNFCKINILYIFFNKYEDKLY